MLLPDKFIKLKIPGPSPVSLLVILSVMVCTTLRNDVLDDGEALKKFNVGKTCLDFHVVNS